MKNASIGFLFLVFFMFAMPVSADEVDDGLPMTVNERIRTQTREMIQVGVPTDDAVEMTRRMVQHQFRNELALQAQQEVIDACRKGLPYGPVLNKLQEGLAKQIPPEDVVPAMRVVRERYEYAYRHANQVTKNQVQIEALGEAQAQGLAAGLKIRDMERINARIMERIRLKTCDDCPRLALESALTTRDMARLGVDSPTTGDVVCMALEKGYDSPRMVRMRHQFRSRLNQEDPQGMANRYAHAFRNGQDPVEDESGFGGFAGGKQNRGGVGSSGGGSGGSGGGSGGRGK
jgi:hypothetical protein